MKSLKSLSLGKKIILGIASLVAVAGLTNGIHQSAANTPTAAPIVGETTAATPKKQSTVSLVETKTETTTEAVAFDSVTQNDASLDTGIQKIATPGVNGVRTKTYSVTYQNGQETGRTEVSNQITTPPVSQVTKAGTKQPSPVGCPNGTYINSAGNEVCSPYSAPSTPAGATARCGDGTYSFSQSRSGTCSHHGGVAVWL